MSKKGENITRRKDGRYEARYVKERDNDGRIKKYGFVYAKTYLEVKKKRDETIKNLEKNKQQKNIFYNKTLAQEIQLWLDCKISIKASSYTNYYSIINAKIIPFFKNITLKELDDKVILDFIKSLQEANLSNKRIKDILLLLKQFLKDKSINIKIDLPKVATQKIETLKPDEILMLEKTAKNTKDVKVFAILLVLFTGLRIGELCALTWQDID